MVNYFIIHPCMCNTKHFSYIRLPLGNENEVELSSQEERPCLLGELLVG